MKTLRMKIYGIVQGVFFRKFVKENADLLNVRGFIRNIDNGSVEVIMEGMDKNVDELLERSKIGPLSAHVKKIDVEEIKHQGFQGFKVLSL